MANFEDTQITIDVPAELVELIETATGFKVVDYFKNEMDNWNRRYGLQVEKDIVSDNEAELNEKKNATKVKTKVK